MRAVHVLALIIACGATRAGAAPSTTATANAWDAYDSHSGTGDVTASATHHAAGASGSSSATAVTRIGLLQGWATMAGSGIALPPPDQICNSGSTQCTFSDLIHVVSDAPDGTPVNVQASYVVTGDLEGTGVYSYETSGIANTTPLPGPHGSSAGLTATVPDLPISGGSTVGVAAITGAAFGLTVESNLGVSNRYSGSESDGWSMTLWLSGVLTLTVPVLPAGATYVNLVADSGHDYSQATAGVSGVEVPQEGLAAARPNPARDLSMLDLTLTRARSVNVGVFDLSGRRVTTLADGALGAGLHTLVWDGRDRRGARVHGGVYFVRARGDGFDASRRVLRIE